MIFKCLIVSLAICSVSHNAEGLSDPLDRGLKYIESIYKELESKVENAYIDIRDTIEGTVFSTVETLDRHVSVAMLKIQSIREDCRAPAEMSLENLSKKAKEDFRGCTDVRIQENVDSIKNKSENLLQTLKESCNTSLTAINACINSEYTALKELRLDIVGSCEFPTGFWVSERFIEDSMSVQKFALEVVSFSYDSTKIITNCFKEELVKSSVESITAAAQKCHNRLRKL